MTLVFVRSNFTRLGLNLWRVLSGWIKSQYHSVRPYYADSSLSDHHSPTVPYSNWYVASLPGSYPPFMENKWIDEYLSPAPTAKSGKNVSLTNPINEFSQDVFESGI